jgi:hypothetical protein
MGSFIKTQTDHIRKQDETIAELNAELHILKQLALVAPL